MGLFVLSLQRGTALLFLLFKLKNGLVGGHQDKYEMDFSFELVKGLSRRYCTGYEKKNVETKAYILIKIL